MAVTAVETTAVLELLEIGRDYSPKEGLRYQRRFSPEAGPFDGIEVSHRDVVLINQKTQKVAFEQRGILAPVDMEQWQLDIFAQHYLRGQLDTEERESSIFQPVQRITDVMKFWAMQGRIMPQGQHLFLGQLFASQEMANAWSDDLGWLLVNWYSIFNSPVWYNIGVPDVPQQCSACFINDSDLDDMERIADWYRTEIRIFKGGSGSGINLSMIRSSYEGIRGGGKASGPCSYMRAADASAGTLASGGRNRRAAKMVELNVDHPDLLIQADGSDGFIWLKAKAERVARTLRDAGFDMSVDSGHDAIHVQYQNANNSVRYNEVFMAALLAGERWQSVPKCPDKVLKPVPTYPSKHIWREHAKAEWECGDPGSQFDDTANHWNTTPAAGRINGSNPCGEYQDLDESPCNLANNNLMKFRRPDGTWDTNSYTAACRIVAIAQTILAAYSDYPTERIGAVARGFRQIGQGYTNLGAIFMADAIAYDSPEARAKAAALTHQMQAAVAITSAEVAAVWGAYPGVVRETFPGDPQKELPGFDHPDNRKAHLGVVALHSDYCRSIVKAPTKAAQKRSIKYGSEIHIDTYFNEVVGQGAPAKHDREIKRLADEGCELYAHALVLGEQFGFANSYWSNIPPMGTSGIVLGQITSGLEPGYNLKVTKKKVSGDWMEIVNPLVLPACLVMGYPLEQAEEIARYADLHNSVVGAPHLLEEQYAVFDTANSEPINGRYLSVQAHILMLAATQVGLSGASSKTINLPNSAKVEDFEEGHFQLWRLGVKAGAFYRDGSKATQPLVASEANALAGPPEPVRFGLPSVVETKRIKLSIPRQGEDRPWKAYLHIGFYPNGQLGEAFIVAGNEGTEINGMMSGAMKWGSLGAQYGVPARALIEMWLGMKHEPHGMLSPRDSVFTQCTSPNDLVAKTLALYCLPADERRALGILTRDERIAQENGEELPSTQMAVAKTEAIEVKAIEKPAIPTLAGDPPWCYAPACGGVRMTVRLGGCWACPNCGSTNGCS